jgi:hypothetical protein
MDQTGVSTDAAVAAPQEVLAAKNSMSSLSAVMERDGAALFSQDKQLISFRCKCGIGASKSKVTIARTGAFCENCQSKNTNIKRIRNKINLMNSLMGIAPLSAVSAAQDTFSCSSSAQDPRSSSLASSSHAVPPPGSMGIQVTLSPDSTWDSTVASSDSHTADSAVLVFPDSQRLLPLIEQRILSQCQLRARTQGTICPSEVSNY